MNPRITLGLGLLVGLGIGLGIAWGLFPVDYVDTYPPLLRTEYRVDWERMTAFTYGVEGNWDRTQLRLRDLDAAEIRLALAQAMQDAVTAGRPLAELQRLAQLAQSYAVDTPAVRIYAGGQPPAGLTPAPTVLATLFPSAPAATALPDPALPLVTATPPPTLLPELFIPTAAVGPTPVWSPYVILSQTLTCTQESRLAVSLVLTDVVTERVRGRTRTRDVLVGLPARELWLVWDDGADRAFTGMRPALGLGYADFAIEPGRLYKLYVGDPIGVPIALILAASCSAPGMPLRATETLVILETH